MAKVVNLGRGFSNPKALLASLMERDDLEWVAICVHGKDGVQFEANNSISLEQISYVACGWQIVFGALSGIAE